tara:strand:- start:109 stop:411 length:303 start_codon:yes stop_codon:yes gene_type:complete
MKSDNKITMEINRNHLKQENETYLQHMGVALLYAAKLLKLVGCLVLHAFVPVIMYNVMRPTFRKLSQEDNERKLMNNNESMRTYTEVCEACGRATCVCFD